MNSLKTTAIACITSSAIGGGMVLLFFASQFQLQPTSGLVEAGTHSAVGSGASSIAAGTRSHFPLEPGLAVSNALTPEEQNNIEVYESGNRSVVNIRTLIRQDFSVFSDVTGEGSGSGWVLDKDGHVVTNHHVVEDAEVVEVKLFNGMSYSADVVGADPANDIALLKIETSPDQLFPVTFADSSELRVGQKIFAIGSPFGLEQTMTTGIVSSLNRSIRSRSGRLINSIIQIDAALNQGNSGGALLDSSGRLVGMNTAIKSRVGENTGVGFAIPANTIARVLPQLIENGRVIRASLGIARVFRLRTDDGVGLGVYSFTGNSPAEAAGMKSAQVTERFRWGDRIVQRQREDIRRADILVGINGQKIESVDKMLAEVEKYRPGTEVEVEVIRDGRRVTVPVVLTEEN